MDNLKMMKRLAIVWGIFLVLIFTCLTIFGFMYKSKSKVYKELENDFNEKTKQYVDQQFLYPDEGKTLKVTSDELIENEIISELKVNDDECIGYTLVTYDSVYEYKSYIKCDHYTTRGYEK